MMSTRPHLNTMKNFSPILAALLLGQTITAAPDSKASASATDNKLPALIYRSNAVYSILEAAKAGAPDVIAARLKEGDNVNQVDEMGNTALHLAARAGSAECVKLLLNAGADTTLPDATGKLASQMATSKKISKMLKSAMAAREEEIALYEKIAAGNLDALKAAARKKTFNPDMLDKENKIPLLAQLCLKKNVAGVRLLIKAGANVNYVASDSRTILHWAIDADHAEIITLLLQAGADPFAPAGNQALPLHDAVWYARTESIKALLPAYKDVNYSPSGGHNGTPINLAINLGSGHVVQLFIDAGINLNDASRGELPLIHAAKAGRAGIITQLLNAGADKNAKNRDNQTARDMAAESVLHLL